MNRPRLLTLALSLLLASALPTMAQASPPQWSSAQLAERALYRRAVEAALWGMPLVNFHQMREGMRRDAGVLPGDVAYFSTVQNWKFQFTTNNGSSPYVFASWQLNGEPLVIEIPPTLGTPVKFNGALMDAWQRPIEDIGVDGIDQGRGARLLLLPEHYQGPIPAQPRYIPLRQATDNGFFLLRSLLADASPDTQRHMLDRIKQFRIYPLSQAETAKPTRHVDVYDTLIDGTIPLDARFFDSLNQMVQEEPVETRDLAIMGQLKTLGIVKGAAFQPSAAQRKVFDEAVNEAGQYALDFILKSGVHPAYGEGNQWHIAAPQSAIQSAFSMALPGLLDIDARAGIYRVAYSSFKRLGLISFYLSSAADAGGQRFNGSQHYRLRIPPNVPAQDFWSVTVYADATAAWFPDLQRATLGSYENLHKNEDGSIDLYFGPTAPAEHAGNWIPTAPDQPYFIFFRFFGPTAAAFDGSFRLNNVERQ